jgi:Tfp pilus assembly protein PilF
MANNPTFLDTRACVLHKLGRNDEAKRIMRQAISLDTANSADLQLHYGDILAALGEKFMAEVYWRKALDNGYDKASVEQRLQRLKQQ